MTTFSTTPPLSIKNLSRAMFQVQIGKTQLALSFIWLGTRWYGYATMPDGSFREFGVYPNTVNWSKHGDYTLEFVTPNESIGFSDLINCTLTITDQAQ
jgi:hypothetical protein